MRRYRLSRKAEEDIIAIFMYGVSQFGIQQAERYHDLLERTFQFLAENPEAARERVEITPAVRVHPIESHIVITPTMRMGTSSSFAWGTDVKIGGAMSSRNGASGRLRVEP